MEFLKQYWFIIIAIFSMSVAVGQSLNKIETLEQAVKSNAQTQAEVAEIKLNQERIDERTRNIVETQSRQERTLDSINNMLIQQSQRKIK